MYPGPGKPDREAEEVLSRPDRPVQKSALVRGKRRIRIPLPHRSGGWMSELKNHGRGSWRN